jgi:hypothetical protein
LGGFCALSGVFILSLPIPIVVSSFANYYKNRLWRNEVAFKKEARRKQLKVYKIDSRLPKNILSKFNSGKLSKC